ncbi:MAG TPA: ATP-binding protein [Mycobacteriales bacterium]|nr:ATP-binding protein [Mycobacteriales bacterium]
MNSPLPVAMVVDADGVRVTLSQTVLDNAPIGMALTTVSGTVLWTNAAMAEVIGIADARTLVGRRLIDLVGEDDARQLAADAAALLAGDDAPRREIHRQSGAEPRWLEVRSSLALDPSGTPVELGDPAEPCVIRQLLDVTERRVAEQRLAEAHRELEERNRELERSNEQLSQFAVVASHDLSEPLRVVAGHVELLQARYDELFDDRGRTWMGFAIDGCTRMRRLIDDLLLYSRTGQELHLEQVALADVVAQAVHRVEALIGDSGARIEVVDPLPEVVVDRGALTQVLANLFSNAIKYARPDVSPCIVIRANWYDAGWRVEVADNGIGIPERHRDRAFQLFQRLHGREIEGTGIGLALCRKVIERHGGTIALATNEPSGTTVVIDLPTLTPTPKDEKP